MTFEDKIERGSFTGTTSADVVEVSLPSMSAAMVQLTGTFSATTTFEVLVDEGSSPTWKAISATNVTTAAAATTATTAGVYQVNVAGARRFRARCSTFVSGTVVVAVNVSRGSSGGGSSSGGGGGAVTIADGSDTALGATTDAANTTGTTGTVVGFLRGLVTLIAGNLRVVGPVAGGAAETGNSISIGFVGTGGTHRNATAAPSVNSTTGTDIIGVGPMVKGTTNFFNQQSDDSGNTKVVGTIAHDGVDSGNPVKSGFRAIAHGANPTAVSAADRTDWLGNVAGVPFVIGGHPNVQTFAQNYTSAQTNAAVITVAAGTKIVVTGFMITAANSNTVDVSARLGFGTASTPAYGAAQLLGTHPGIAPGSGFGRGGGAGILGAGADDEDLRITCSVPTGGSVDVMVSYYTISV